jgi:hypothetical protein
MSEIYKLLKKLLKMSMDPGISKGVDIPKLLKELKLFLPHQ